MPSDVEAEESYQSNTVEELREELRARGLPISGHKDDLVARLKEDDADAEAEEAEANGEAEAKEPSNEVAVREGEGEEAPADPYKRVYSPYELPANTAAAQAFVDAHPGDVDPSLELPPDQQAAAQVNIQDHVDTMATVGVIVEDPRLGGYVPPDPGPHIDSLDPSSSATGQQVTVTVVGSGFDDTSKVEIDQSAQATTFVDASTLTVDHRSTMPSGTEVFTVRNGDGQESNDMTFNVTQE
jgi:hypothetical protein